MMTGQTGGHPLIEIESVLARRIAGRYKRPFRGGAVYDSLELEKLKMDDRAWLRPLQGPLSTVADTNIELSDMS